MIQEPTPLQIETIKSIFHIKSDLEMKRWEFEPIKKGLETFIVSFSDAPTEDAACYAVFVSLLSRGFPINPIIRAQNVDDEQYELSHAYIQGAKDNFGFCGLPSEFENYVNENLKAYLNVCKYKQGKQRMFLNTNTTTKKYYHKGNGQCVVAHGKKEPENWEEFLSRLPVVAQCDPETKIGWMHGYKERYEVYDDKNNEWLEAEYYLYKRDKPETRRIILVPAQN